MPGFGRAFAIQPTATQLYSVNFTKRQSQHVQRILDEWLRVAAARPGVLHPLLHMRIRLLRDMIVDDIGWDASDFELLKFVLEMTYLPMSPDEVDPLGEQVYCKCAGHWLEGRPPWYDRVRALDPNAQSRPLAT